MSMNLVRRVFAALSIIIAIASAAYLSARIEPFISFFERAILTIGYAFGVGILGVRLATSSKKDVIKGMRTFFLGK